jgi:cellulose synthase operon protein C
VKRPNGRGLAPFTPIGALATRGAEALQQERFKEAAEVFKQMIRQDPRPEWKQSLADAYRGRARVLVAKKMFKEATMVLENTLAPDGTLRDPVFYLRCLIRDGQHQKAAAHALQYIGADSTLSAGERPVLEELTAALLVAVPMRVDLVRTSPAERARWLQLAASSREALAAWIAGATAEAMEPLLNRISLRSAFRPVRLLLKSLATPPQDAERSRRLLDAIPPGSPFFAFREAVEAAVLGERVLDADGWHRLTPAQQAFVAETRRLPAAASQFLARSGEAARNGPATLFAFLLKQPDLPQADVRSACLNLLPQIPDRLPQFERSFGPLPDLERHRIQALAAEARGDWGKAERSWQAAVAAIVDGDDARQARLSRGVIFRHLADLAAKHREIEGDGDALFDNPVISYLEHSCRADPDYVPAVLELIGYYRADSRLKDWHRLADEAVQRFPDNSAVLLQATESAMARKAYKKAAGFARSLLKIDPINPGVRRQMIELQVAHARKQVRAARLDLAAKELATAAEWERSEAPNALLRIARGLVALQSGAKEQAETWLREGVALVGGGVAGWFRAVLEAELMKFTGGDALLLRRELAHARETPPTSEAILAIVSALGQPEAGENKRALAGLLLGMRVWLLQGAIIDWPPVEFQALAETLARFDAFDLLQEYARAARRRDPGNPAWRFHEIVARTKGNADRLSMSETDDLIQMADAAVARSDFHTATRIGRFLNGDGGAPSGRRRKAAPMDSLDDAAMLELVAAMLADMPKGSVDGVRAIVADFGREAAVAQLVEQFRASPLPPGMPEPLLRVLCEAMVTKATDGSGRQHAGAARRSRL